MKEMELKNLRREREKHFLRGDGFIVAQMYDDNVHYKFGNEYKEIDNTLEKKMDIIIIEVIPIKPILKSVVKMY